MNRTIRINKKKTTKRNNNTNTGTTTGTNTTMGNILTTDSLENCIIIFSGTSVENLFTYLRFECFPNQTDEEKKALISLAMMAPCRSDIVLEPLLMAARKSDYLECISILKRNRVNFNVNEIAFSKDVDQMVNLFFAENDQADACNLLTTLLNFPMNDPEGVAYKAFVENYRNEKDPMAKASLRKCFHYNAQLI